MADILGVTTEELRRGESWGLVSEDTEASAGPYGKEHVRALQRIAASAFSILLLVGALVCAICDLALSGTLTWSGYPISSILFVWLVLVPVVRFGSRGVVGTLAAFSIFVIPFLWVLNRLIGGSELLLPIGIRMTVIALAFLWSVFVVCKRWKTRGLIKAALFLLLAIPLSLVINVTLSSVIAESLLDGWDLLSFTLIGMIAVGCLMIDAFMQKKRRPVSGVL